MAREASPARLRSLARRVHQHDPSRVVTREQQITAALPKRDRARVIESSKRRSHRAACDAIYAAATRTA